MKINISVECATEDEALDVVNRIAGTAQDAGSDVETETKSSNSKSSKTKSSGKKETPKQKAASKTKSSSKAKSKPAPAEDDESEAPSVEELKRHIVGFAGDMTDKTVAASVKEFIKNYDVNKLSEMSAEQRQQAYDDAEEYFSGSESEDDDDPMA